jgi:hypothetical protein
VLSAALRSAACVFCGTYFFSLLRRLRVALFSKIRLINRVLEIDPPTVLKGAVKRFACHSQPSLSSLAMEYNE